MFFAREKNGRVKKSKKEAAKSTYDNFRKSLIKCTWKKLSLKFCGSSYPPKRNLCLWKKRYAIERGKVPVKKYTNSFSPFTWYGRCFVTYEIHTDIYILRLRPDTPANVDKYTSKWGSKGTIHISLPIKYHRQYFIFTRFIQLRMQMCINVKKAIEDLKANFRNGNLQVLLKRQYNQRYLLIRYVQIRL